MLIHKKKYLAGWWYGLELEKADGKNDGSVNGKKYFTCKPKHGVFAPPSRVQKYVYIIFKRFRATLCF